MNPPSLRLSKRKTRHSVSSFLEGTAKVDVFQGQIKPPRSGGPKPEPSSSGSGLEARSTRMSAR